MKNYDDIDEYDPVVETGIEVDFEAMEKGYEEIRKNMLRSLSKIALIIKSKDPKYSFAELKKEYNELARATGITPIETRSDSLYTLEKPEHKTDFHPVAAELCLDFDKTETKKHKDPADFTIPQLEKEQERLEKRIRHYTDKCLLVPFNKKAKIRKIAAKRRELVAQRSEIADILLIRTGLKVPEDYVEPEHTVPFHETYRVVFMDQKFKDKAKKHVKVVSDLYEILSAKFGPNLKINDHIPYVKEMLALLPDASTFGYYNLTRRYYSIQNRVNHQALVFHRSQIHPYYPDSTIRLSKIGTLSVIGLKERKTVDIMSGILFKDPKDSWCISLKFRVF